MAFSTDNRLLRLGNLIRRGVCLSLILALGLGLGACRRKTPEEMLNEARDLFGNRDILGAEMKYEKILERNPEGEFAAYAHMGLANCYFADNDFSRGREQCDIVLKAIGTKSPQYISVLDQKIASYFREKKPEQAIDAALATSATLHGAPEQLRQTLQLKLAEIYLANKKEDKAIEICTGAIHNWPDVPQLHLAALDVMSKGPQERKDFKKALGLYETYLKEHPKAEILPEIYFSIGSYLKELGQTAEANKSFDQSEQEVQTRLAAALGAETKGTLLFKLSRIQQGRGNIPAARVTMGRVVKDFPKSEIGFQAQFMLVRMSLEEGKTQDAVTALNQIIKDNPKSEVGIQAQFFLAQVLLESGKPQDAIGTLNLIIKDQPDSQAAYNAYRGIQQIQAQAMRMTSGTLGMRPTSGTLAMQPTSATLVRQPAPAAAVTTATAAPKAAATPAPASSPAPAVKTAGTPKP